MSGESLPSGVLKVAEAKRLADEAKIWIAQVAVAAHQRSPARIKVAVEALEAFIDQLAALASPPPQATGAPQWLPIESAPKDGTLILGAAGWVEQGWWDDDRGEWWPHNTHWTDAHGGCLYPTHWQPLPAAPTAASQVEPEDKQ